MRFWRVASLKFIEQAGRSEIQVRVDVAVLFVKSAEKNQVGSKLKQGCYVAMLRPNSFLFRKPLFLVTSTDWMKPTHIMEGNLHYSKTTDHMIKC